MHVFKTEGVFKVLNKKQKGEVTKGGRGRTPEGDSGHLEKDKKKGGGDSVEGSRGSCKKEGVRTAPLKKLQPLSKPWVTIH